MLLRYVIVCNCRIWIVDLTVWWFSVVTDWFCQGGMSGYLRLLQHPENKLQFALQAKQWVRPAKQKVRKVWFKWVVFLLPASWSCCSYMLFLQQEQRRRVCSELWAERLGSAGERDQQWGLRLWDEAGGEFPTRPGVLWSPNGQTCSEFTALSHTKRDEIKEKFSSKCVLKCRLSCCDVKNSIQLCIRICKC